MEIKDFKENCKKAISALKRDLQKMRSGRATSGLVEDITVDYFGAQVPIKQLGNVTVPEPRLISIQLYDANAGEAVEKAIRESDLGLNPSREGAVVRISVPPLTEERRMLIIKTLKKRCEEARIAVRGHRRDMMDSIRTAVKNKELSEEDAKREQEEVQKITDQFIDEIDKLMEAKEEEVKAI